MENEKNSNYSQDSRNSQDSGTQNSGAAGNNENRSFSSDNWDNDSSSGSGAVASGTNPDRYQTSGSDYENRDRSSGMGRNNEENPNFPQRDSSFDSYGASARTTGNEDRDDKTENSDTDTANR